MTTSYRSSRRRRHLTLTHAAETFGIRGVDASLVELPASRPPLAARNLPLLVLATLACVAFLSWAQSFLVPLMLGIVISYALTPLVAWFEAVRIPRSIGTVIVMASVIGGMCLGAYSLRGQVQTIIDQVPEAATQFAAGTSRMQLSRAGNLKTIQDAATKVEKATSQAAGASGSASGGHPRHRGHAQLQAQRLPVEELDGRRGRHGPGGDGRLPGLLPAARRRHVQAEAGPNRGSVTVPNEDRRSHTRRHQRLDPEIHADVPDDQSAGRAAQLDRVSLDRPRQRRGLGGGCGPAARRPVPWPGSDGRRNGTRRLHAIPVNPNGAAGRRRVAGDRDGRRDAPDHLDDRPHRQHEPGGRVHFTAVLGLAVGCLGNAAQRSSHRHRQGRLAARRSSCTRWPNCSETDPTSGVRSNARDRHAPLQMPGADAHAPAPCFVEDSRPQATTAPASGPPRASALHRSSSCPSSCP